MKLLSKEEFDNVTITAKVKPEVKVKKKKMTMMDKVGCDTYKRNKAVKKDEKEFNFKLLNMINKSNLRHELEQDTHRREVAINFLKLANVYEESDYIKKLKETTRNKKLAKFKKMYQATNG